MKALLTSIFAAFLLCAMCHINLADASVSGDAFVAYRALVADYGKTSGGISPAMSPDGRCLVYLSTNVDIWLARCDDTDIVQPATPWKLSLPEYFPNPSIQPILDKTVARSIDWSPDGKRFVFCFTNGHLAIAESIDYKRRTATIKIICADKPISETNGAVGSPRWSPDGKLIAFLRPNAKDANTYVVCVVNPSDESESVVASNAVKGGLAWGQPWSPDGKELVYSSLSNTTKDVRKVGISIVSIKDKKAKALKVPNGSASPSWSSNGRIAFVADKNVKIPVATGIDAGIGASAIWVCSRKGEYAHLLTKPLASIESDVAKMSALARSQFRAVFKERLGSKLSIDQQKRLKTGALTNDEIADLLWLIPARSIGGDFQKLSEKFVRMNKSMRERKMQASVSALQQASDAALSALPSDKTDWFVRNSFGVVYEVSNRIWRDNFASDERPVWAPDGSKFLFVRTGSAGEDETLMVMDAKTGRESAVYRAGQIDCMSWARDGRAIIIQSKRLMSLEKSIANGATSADGIFSSASTTTVPGYPEIWLVQLKPRAIVAALDRHDEPTQSPPDTQLAENVRKIYLVPSRVGLLNGGKQQFKVFGLDVKGKQVPINKTLIWEADSDTGGITGDGIFTADGKEGVHDFAVKVFVGKLRAAATVEVLPRVVESGYVLDRVIGGLVPGIFKSPKRVAVGRDGAIYVADSINSIQKLDASGKFLGMWKCDPGNMLGCNNSLGSIAVDSESNVFIAENQSVRKFDSSGKIICEWNHFRKEGARIWAALLAIDKKDNLYVVNYLASRIEKFDSHSKMVATIESADLNAMLTSQPVGIAVDSDGFIFIIDMVNHRVHKLNPAGKLVTSFGDSKNKDEQLLTPTAITIDADNRVCVWDGSYSCIKVYTSEGYFVRKLAVLDTTDKNSNSICGMANDDQGNFFVAGDTPNMVTKLDRDGNFVADFGLPQKVDGIFYTPSALATDSNKNLYIMDYGTNSIQKFDSFGTFIGNFPRSLDKNWDSFLHITKDGKCYTRAFNSICGFDIGLQSPSLTVPFSKTDNNSTVQDAAFTNNGNIYELVSNGSNCSLILLEPGKEPKTLYDSKAHPNEELSAGAHVAADEEGNVYVTRDNSAKAIKITADGQITKIILAEDKQQVTYCIDVDTDQNGNVYFLANINSDSFIFVHDKDGIDKFCLPIRSRWPMHMEVGSDGAIYTTGGMFSPAVERYSLVKQ